MKRKSILSLSVCTALLASSLTTVALAAPSVPVVKQNAVQVDRTVPIAISFDAKAPIQAEQGKVVNFTLEAKRAKIEISPGEFKEVWTFNGSVPGPTLRVNQGDTVHFTMVNKDPEMEHGLDFHAGQMDMGTYHKALKPGESISFDWKADYPGVFYYHCSASPVIMHIANGMFGAVIVDPPGYKPEGKEYVLIQHEWYENSVDLNELIGKSPKALAFNGTPLRYMNDPLTSAAGENVRFYFVNAGINHFSAFHVIGTIFDQVLFDGNPENKLRGVQTVAVPPGGAVVADLKADKGTYAILTHVMRDATKGALGVLKVGELGQAYDAASHGSGDMVPAPAAKPISAQVPPSSVKEQAVNQQVVHLSNYAFSPNVIKVKAGTTITWVNDENVDHTVVDASAAEPKVRLFDSTGEKDGKPTQYLKKGDTFSYTFNKPGTYKYKCLPHPFMTGQIVVE